MSQFKGTPGPWLIDHDRANEINRIHAYSDHRIGQRVIADVRFGFDEPVESQQHANARLIAAAPDLLEALHAARRAIGDHHAPNDCYATGPVTGDAFRDLVECPACAFIAKYDAAIAKATGEQP